MNAVTKPKTVVDGEKRWGKWYTARYDSATMKFIGFVDGHGDVVAEEDVYAFIEYHRDLALYWRQCLGEVREVFRVTSQIYARWDE